MKRLLLAFLILGCQPDAGVLETEKAARNPAVIELHLKLFGAADAADVNAFTRLLTRASVLGIEQHFEQLRNLPKPDGEKDVGWSTFLKLHSNLPRSARNQTPYPVQSEDGELKLHILGHPNGVFLTARTQPKK